MVDFKNTAISMGLCVMYIVISGCLIHFNKQIVKEGRFPHAMVLTTLHMFTTTVLCNVLYLVAPSFYPSMEQTKGKRLQLLKYFVPLGMLFAVGLFCSNQAYLYCSAAFLQFMKEANLVLVYLMSGAVGLLMFSRARMVNIVWIIVGAALSVHGEVNFALIGFIIQLISQLGECSKNVLGDWLMNGNMKLDPLTYTMFMAPVCLVVLIIGSAVTWKATILPDIAKMWPLLIPNCCIAFALNVTIAVLIKRCSAIAFVLAGIVKDVAIVVVAVFCFNEKVVGQQILGFIICLTGVFFWSFAKLYPDNQAVSLWNKMCYNSDPEGKKAAETLPLITNKNDVK